MKHKMVIAVGLITVLVTMMAVSGCGSTPTPETVIQTVVVEKEVVETVVVEKEAEPELPQEVTVTLWYYTWPPANAYFEERIRAYMEANPHVTVDYNFSIPPVGVGGWEDKLTTSLATGTAPDIFVIQGPQTANYLAKGLISPIDEEALEALGYKSLDELKATWYPGAMGAWSDDNGVPYAYNEELGWYSLYCNTDHLVAGGVDPETLEIETWDDFIGIGKSVIDANSDFYKDKDGNFARNFFKLSFYADDTWAMDLLTAYLAQSGGSFLTEDGKKAAINEPEGVKAVETMMRLSHELGDPNVGPMVPGEIFAEFSASEQTCVVSGPWMYGAFLKAVDSPVIGHYVVLGFPSIEAGRPGNAFTGVMWTVNAASQNKREAWKLLRFMAADPQGQMAAIGTWAPLPGIEKGWAGQQIPFAEEVAASAKGAAPTLRSVHYPEIARILRAKLEKMAFEGADVQATLDEAAAEIDAILK